MIKAKQENIFSSLSNQHLITVEILAFLLVNDWFTLQMTVAAFLNITFAGAGKKKTLRMP